MEFLSRKDCEELKAAGYPQANTAFYAYPNGDCVMMPGQEGAIACPTLDELIDSILAMDRSVVLNAEAFEQSNASCWTDIEYGNTPLKAVKALWLLIKEKQL